VSVGNFNRQNQWNSYSESLVSPNPFDFRTVMFARHTQQDVGLDLIANWTKRRSFADAAYCNLTVAALAALFVIATGILAWQLQLEG
jgi:hypothetical protein